MSATLREPSGVSIVWSAAQIDDCVLSTPAGTIFASSAAALTARRALLVKLISIEPGAVSGASIMPNFRHHQLRCATPGTKLWAGDQRDGAPALASRTVSASIDGTAVPFSRENDGQLRILPIRHRWRD